jgi:hypothetical protein
MFIPFIRISGKSHISRATGRRRVILRYGKIGSISERIWSDNSVTVWIFFSSIERTKT